MIELTKEIFSKLGIPGLFASILFIIIKLSPITTLSSSLIELKLSSKEKRTFIKGLRTFIEILLYVVFLLIITAIFFTNENIYNPYVALFTVFLFFAVFIWVLILDMQGKTFKDFQKWKVPKYIMILISFISFFIITSYYTGTQFYSEIYNDNLTMDEKTALFIFVVLLYFFIIISFYFTVIKTFYRFLGFNTIPKTNIIITIEKEVWYVFYPIEKNVFLLGDKNTLNDCKKYTFINKEELLKTIIEIE